MMRGLYAAGALLVLLAVVYWLGGRDNRAAVQIETLERERDIKDAIQTGNDSPAWRDLLLERD